MKSSDLNWMYFNTICHLSPLYLFSFMFYYGHFEAQKLRASLVSSIPNPLSTSQFCTDLFWRKSQSYLMNILNVKSIWQRWPVSLSTYVSVCLFMPCCMAYESLAPWPGVGPRPSAVKVPSPQHWTATELN